MAPGFKNNIFFCPAASYFTSLWVIDPSYKLRLMIKPRKEWLHTERDQKTFLATVYKTYRSLRKIILKWSNRCTSGSLRIKGWCQQRVREKKKRPNFKHSLSNYLLDMSYRLWKVPKGIVFFLYLGKICLTCHTDKGTLDQAEFIVTVSFVSILKAKY